MRATKGIYSRPEGPQDYHTAQRKQDLYGSDNVVGRVLDVRNMQRYVIRSLQESKVI